MRLWLAILLVAVAAFAEEEQIVDEYITAKEVADLRENGETVVIAFSTKHCPHCQRFGSKLREYRRAFEKSELAAKIHKMDTQDSENKDFVEQFEIRGVPTVYVFVGQQSGVLYEGNREADDLTKFVKKLQHLKVEVITDEDALAAFKSNYPAVLAVVSDIEKKIDAIEAASKENIDVNFAYLASDVAKAAGISDGIHIFREDGNLTLPEMPETLASFTKWLKVAVLKSISSFPAAAKDLFSSGLHDILFLIDSAKGALSESWVGELAESLRGKIAVASIDRDNEETSHALEFFSVDNSDKNPAIRIFNDEKRKQYRLEGDLNKETLSAWLEKYFAGEIQPHMKSEVLGDDWNAKPTVTLVGSNFKEVAFDKEKDVFVFFHAPWCGHCKKLAPHWEELANSYADNDQVIIAKLDATANDIDDGHEDLRGFPTIRLYKSGDNEMVEYNGERSLEALQTFIKEQTGASASPASESSEEHKESEEHDEL